MAAPDDVIAAIATPRGAGGIGVVRISGRRAPEVAAKIIALKTKTANGIPHPRTVARASFLGEEGGVIDDGIVLYFPEPFSFTGQNVVELQGHGGAAVMDSLLASCLNAGARAAEPGEFTLRAHLNGKLDLAQAEGLCDLILAADSASARAAAASLSGALSAAAENIAKKITALRAEMESRIDFADEDLGAEENPLAAFSEIESDIESLLREAEHSAKLSAGLRIVIIGAPNVGKSSLLNKMAGENAAIVTAKAGTTRDTVWRDITVGGVAVRLSDTAGLRESADEIEAEGIARAMEAARSADMLIAVSDGENPAPEIKENLAAAVIPVRNKIDLSGEAPGKRNDTVYLSAKTGAGMESLRAEILRAAGISDWQPAFSARARHITALRESAAHIKDAKKTATHAELSCASLQQAQRATETITGEVSNEEILSQIFSRFCIGK